MGKGNEDLKAKIAKIQAKGKAPVPKVDEEIIEDEGVLKDEVLTEEPTMEALEAEFEAKKQALVNKQKAKSVVEPVEDQEAQDDDAGIEKAIAEYSDEGKFRVEVIFQLVQLNKSFKDIADTLKGLASNDGE